MPRVFGWPAALLAAAVAGLVPAAAPVPPTAGVASGGGAAVAVAPPPLADDPFPVRRLRVTGPQLAELLKNDPGPLVRLPRPDFEARVRAAGRAVRAAADGPRLTEARYAARLNAGGLTGTAEWVVAAGPAPAALSLDPLKLAVRSVAWADGRDAVVGHFGPGFPAGPAVWVDFAGERVLRAAWSAAGTVEPGGRQFDLSVPPAPVVSLELDLPADRTPAAGPDQLLTGPFPVPGDDTRRKWALRASGAGRLEFAVRSAGGGDRAAVTADLAARYELAPGQLTAVFEYDLQPARGPVGGWAFDVDPGLRVTDVVVNNPAGWRADPGVKAGSPGRLRVQLRQPAAGGKVVVTAVAPLPDPARGPDAPLPMVRPPGGVVGSERLDVRLHPDLKLDGWSPGDYRLTDAPAAADRTQAFTLVGSLAPAGADRPFRQPPAVRVVPAAAEFATREELDWRADAGRLTLRARVAVRVTRGPLFTLPVQLPAGYAVERVTTTPDDLSVATGPASGAPPTLTVEFARPLLPGQSVDLRFDLKGPPLPPLPWPGAGRAAGGQRFAFPRFAPVGAVDREGVLAVAAGSGWSAAADPAGPGGRLAYRGKEPDGWLTVTPRVAALSAVGATTVRDLDGRVTATTRLTVGVTAGAVPGLVVSVPDDAPGRTWAAVGETPAVTAADRLSLGDLPALLPLLTAGGPLAGAVAARAGLDAGPVSLWRLTLARPAAGEVVVETAAVVAGVGQFVDTRPLPRLAPGVAVPLPVVVGCSTQAHAVRLARPLAAGWELVPGAQAVDPRAVRRVAFSPRRPPAAAARSEGSRGDGLYWVGRLAPAGGVTAVFGGHVESPAGDRVGVRLPDGAEPLAAVVGGRWVEPLPRDGATVRLPIPPGRTAFEVRYRLDAPIGWYGSFVQNPLPELLAPGGATSRAWVLPAGLTPVTWLGPPARVAADVRVPLTGAFPAAGEVAWEAGGDGGLAAVRDDAVNLGGVALAVAVLVGGWRLRRHVGRPTAVAAAAALAAAGVGLILAPGVWAGLLRPPVVAGLAVAAGRAVVRGRRAAEEPSVDAARPPARGSSRLPAATVGVALVACGLTATLRGQPQPPAVVYLVEPAAGEVETVLAPRGLLDRLDALAKPPLPAAVVTAAAYDGRAAADAARFTARFTVHALRDGPQVVELPLADVQVSRVLVDGAAAFPMSPRPDVYAVPVAGPGRHEVEVRFAVPVGGVGGDREVRFGIPEAAAGRLTFVGPKGARQVQAVGGRGAVAVAAGAKLETDTGGGRAVHLRWREGTGGPGPAVRARAAAVWDVTEGGAELTACFSLRVEPGTARLDFDLPAGLEPTRVVARSPDLPGGGVLRDWSVEDRGGGRLLRLDLQARAEGKVVVTLECQPRSALSRQPALRFPRLTGAANVEAVYALRTSAVAVDAVAASGLAEAGPELLLKDRDFGTLADLKLDPQASIKVFRPQGAAVPVVRPTLHPVGDLPAGRQEVRWRVGLPQAEGEGVLRWVAREAPLPGVEFDVPAGVRVLEVRGADLAGWVRTGGRVFAWFRKPVRDAAVEWVGVAPTAAAAKPPDPLAFEPPVMRMIEAAPGPVLVRVRPPDGWGVRLDRPAVGWQPLPGPEDGTTAWGFLGDTAAAAAPPRVNLYPPRPPKPAAGFGLFEADGGRFAYRAAVTAPAAAGRPVHATVRVDDLPDGATAELEVPPDHVVSGHASSTDKGAWHLDVVPAGAAGVRAAVVVRGPAPAAGVVLPRVSVTVGREAPGGGPDSVRWLGVVGALRPTGLAAVTDAERVRLRAAWPGEADRVRRAGGSVWAVGDRPDPVRLAVPAAPSAAAPAPAARAPTPPPPPAAVAEAGPDDSRAAARQWGEAVGWVAAVGLLALMAARFPRATWPEQLAVAGGLTGVAVGGGPLLAVPVLAFGRAAWLLGKVVRG